MKKVRLISKRFSVVSEPIKDIEYNYEFKWLKVKFNSGTRYKYSNVPLQTWNNLVKSSSKGTYFNKHIYNKYKYQRII